MTDYNDPVRTPVIVRYATERPGPGWDAHGSTRKNLWVLHEQQLVPILLVKQRWLHVSTGTTRHDRPAYDVPGSPFGLDVAFFLIGHWLTSVAGLHNTDWPWSNSRPARRTLQRWLARLAPDADHWLIAIRLACIERAAPRPLEEKLPTGGIPPPAVRRTPWTASAWRLNSSAWTLKETAQALSISTRDLLTEARRRWNHSIPTTA